jgi:hypothetical protein
VLIDRKISGVDFNVTKYYTHTHTEFLNQNINPRDEMLRWQSVQLHIQHYRLRLLLNISWSHKT